MPPRPSDGAYPPSPAELPAGLLATRGSYRLRVVLVLLGLLAFVALYAGLVALVVEAFPILWSTHVHADRFSIAIFVGSNVALAALLVFLAKGLFRRQRRSIEGLVELTRQDEPELFAFVDRLVLETGAPRPARIYVDGSVNAAVFYETSLLSLVWPVRKNLLLGLGLVNHLTRSELKAILGHELGHFGQRAMKVGSYVYVTHGIVQGLVEPDWFDDALRSAARSDWRIAILAYIVLGLTTLVRLLLRGAFAILAFGHSALMRDMELAADRVAVSVAGSDAIARGLYKAELADACAAHTARALVHASDHGMVTSDFFFHQSRVLPDVRRLAERPDWGEIPPGQTRLLFAEDTVTQPSMWASHPPSAAREHAAKAIFVASDHDERPAWTFFRDPDALRARISEGMRLPIDALRKATPAEEVERFLEAERAEDRALARFGEMYTGRPLKKLDEAAVFDAPAAAGADANAIARELAAVSMDEVAKLSARFREVGKVSLLLQRAEAGGVRDEALVVGGRRIERSEIPKRLAALRAEAKEIDEGFEALDEALLRVTAKMAHSLGEGRASALRERYAQVVRLQAPMSSLRGAIALVEPSLALMGSGRDLTDAQARSFLGWMDDLRSELFRVVAAARGQTLPAMEKVAEGTDLADFLWSRALPSKRPEVDVGAWIPEVLAAVGEVADKLQRLHKKAIVAMVVEIAAIGSEWQARHDHPTG